MTGTGVPFTASVPASNGTAYNTFPRRKSSVPGDT